MITSDSTLHKDMTFWLQNHTDIAMESLEGLMGAIGDDSLLWVVFREIHRIRSFAHDTLIGWTMDGARDDYESILQDISREA